MGILLNVAMRATSELSGSSLSFQTRLRETIAVNINLVLLLVLSGVARSPRYALQTPTLQILDIGTINIT
jgi:uncharacterized membrane protein